jgi:hypothetical protein
MKERDTQTEQTVRDGNLGLMHNLLLQLDEFYSSHIDGLPEKVRTKVSPKCIV